MVKTKYVLATCSTFLLLALLWFSLQTNVTLNVGIENIDLYKQNKNKNKNKAAYSNTFTAKPADDETSSQPGSRDPQKTDSQPIQANIISLETRSRSIATTDSQQAHKSNTELGITPRDQCFKTEIPMRDSLTRMLNTYYKGYVEFGRKWSAMPVCPAKDPNRWYKNKRHLERHASLNPGGDEEKPPKVVICSTIAANEEAFVREWAGHHLLLGVSAINIYPINLEQRRKLEQILYKTDPPFDKQLVWVNEIEAETGEAWMAEGSHHVSFEKRTIAHCFRERLNDTDIVLHIDLDEYVYPGLYPDIPTLFMAELGDNHMDELAFCVRYAGYGKDPPTENKQNNSFYLQQITHTGTFCSNSKTGGMSRCVKKPAVKVRSHYVHYLPLIAGCRPHGNMIGVLLKKGPPDPCCRPSYFIAHMQHRDFQLDRRRRKRETQDYNTQLSMFVDWHTMTSLPDQRLVSFGNAVELAISKECFTNAGSTCPVDYSARTDVML
eukprot:TRINITY_DN2746_c0_g1_i1.p1 TRINITY_DN2746_c0_g1~~TRINITY_DN2746_c0_g1_i1.p1  ORF type:complete len:494 (+),score=41.22 TRINITY_DN2746_c0_g1_i1:28-1509(+)